MGANKQANKEKYDLLCIGSGPAGIHGAMQASKLGKKVAIIEKNPQKIGGTWIHTGTIPSKTLREVLAAIHNISPHVGEGWVKRVISDLSSTRLLNRADDVSNEEETLIRKHLANNNIEVIPGTAFLEDRHHVRVTSGHGKTKVLESDKILIATGSRPRRPADIPFDGWRVIDSDEILKLESLPKSILVFGAGVIGCEYACIFSAIGIETIIIDARTRIMQTIDREIAEELKSTMQDLGVTFKLGYQLKHIESKGPQVTAVFDQEPITTDIFFFSAGRESSTSGLGLDRVGIKTNNRGAILVNEFFQTDAGNVYAAGDAIGPPALASTSSEQGRLAMCHAFDNSECKFPEVFPVGVYTIPELSSVGMSEEDVVEAGIEYVVGRANYDEIARGYIRGEKHGLLKLIVNAKTEQIVGVHIVGSDAANLIHIGQCCMLSGLPLSQILRNIIFNYPTLAEGYRVAAFNALNKINSGAIERPKKKPRSKSDNAA